jgi:hypothetical protein
MDNHFITNLLLGSFSDPILWIISIVIASNIISSLFIIKLFYLTIAGIIWGYIRLYIYKSFGQEFTFNQTFVVIMLCLMLMVFMGSLVHIIFNIIKTKT